MQSGANSILLLSVNDIASMPAGTDQYTDNFSIIICKLYKYYRKITKMYVLNSVINS